MTERICTRCQLPQPASLFYNSRGRPRTTCKSCDEARRQRRLIEASPEQQAAAKVTRSKHRVTEQTYQIRYRRKNRAKALVKLARERAAPRGIPFDLDPHIEELQCRIDAGFCEVTGVPFNLDGGGTFDSPTLDRKKPELGYVIGNIRVVCWLINSAMGNWGEDTLRRVMSEWLSKTTEGNK